MKTCQAAKTAAKKKKKEKSPQGFSVQYIEKWKPKIKKNIKNNEARESIWITTQTKLFNSILILLHKKIFIFHFICWCEIENIIYQLPSHLLTLSFLCMKGIYNGKYIQICEFLSSGCHFPFHSKDERNGSSLLSQISWFPFSYERKGHDLNSNKWRRPWGIDEILIQFEYWFKFEKWFFDSTKVLL